MEQGDEAQLLALATAAAVDKAQQLPPSQQPSHDGQLEDQQQHRKAEEVADGSANRACIENRPSQGEHPLVAAFLRYLCELQGSEAVRRSKRMCRSWQRLHAGVVTLIQRQCSVLVPRVIHTAPLRFPELFLPSPHAAWR